MTTRKLLRAIKDRRSAWYRRHCQLADAFAKDLGDNLSAADQALASHAATVTLECEMLKVRQLNGEAVDLDAVVRLTNALSRIRTELGKRAGAAKAAGDDDWQTALYGMWKPKADEEDNGETETEKVLT